MLKMNLRSETKSGITAEIVPSSSKNVVTGCSVLETLHYLFALVIVHFVYPLPHALKMK